MKQGCISHRDHYSLQRKFTSVVSHLGSGDSFSPDRQVLAVGPHGLDLIPTNHRVRGLTSHAWGPLFQGTRSVRFLGLMSSDLRKATVPASRAQKSKKLLTLQNSALLYERRLLRLPSQTSSQTASKTPPSLQTLWLLSLGLNQDTCMLTLLSPCVLCHTPERKVSSDTVRQCVRS